MMEQWIAVIAKELTLTEARVRATLDLLGEGGTVPFIARYRKEATGSLDEVAVAAIRDRWEQLTELDKRREAILKSMAGQNHLTPELERKLAGAETLVELEDIYLPFRPKRRTRAMAAKEKGLEPLAGQLLEQGAGNPEDMAALFVDVEKGVADASEALAGARDILAEQISENPELRGRLRGLFAGQGKISSKLIKGREEAGQKFKDYFDWEEPLASTPSHRFLAMVRGRNEGVLAVQISGIEEPALGAIRELYWKNNGTPASDQVALAIEDGFKRLLRISLEVEVMVEAKKRADEEAIRVFAENLRELLLAPPLGARRILAIDPGFRTGCKVACLDAQGKFLANYTIYPHTPGGAEKASREIPEWVAKYGVEAIAIGNGTAGRETEEFIRGLNLTAPVVMVNESGASIYSASEAAREEFPDQDLTVRGAVSIGRRLLDPLAELVKIDPKSIGVGQYQHDVNQRRLKQSLDDVVVSCVNAVGVNVNTASKQILTYVSGLGPRLAEELVAFRNEHGAFGSRAQLLEVPKLGKKNFEQAAGFLRIPGAEDPLDGSAVHPERYGLVAAMARDLGCTPAELIRQRSLREKIVPDKYLSDSVGLPTLQDILRELDKPGRDPRRRFELFAFAAGVNTLEDLRPGMLLPGIVTNVTQFGAFVDIGVHQDGLVHISELADHYVKDPGAVVKVSQRVQVRVREVDPARRRISLSMKSAEGGAYAGKPGAGFSKEKKTAPAGPAAKQAPGNDWKQALRDWKPKS